MAGKIPAFLLEGDDDSGFAPQPGRGRLSLPFLDRGIRHLAGMITTSYLQWESSTRNGVLQRLDARVKVIAWISLLFVISIKRELMPEVWIGLSLFVLAALCGAELRAIYKRAAALCLFFGFLIALPSGLNLVTRGEVVLPLVRLPREYDLWIYHIPSVIGFTRPGMAGVAMLSLRVLNSVSLSLLILYTTPFTEIIAALRVLMVPDTFLMITALSYKYIFLFARTVEEMHLAMKSRLAGEISRKEARRWITGRMGLLFRRTQMRCEDVYKAMLGRGFSNGFRLVRKRGLTPLDWSFGCLFLSMEALFLWI